VEGKRTVKKKCFRTPPDASTELMKEFNLFEDDHVDVNVNSPVANARENSVSRAENETGRREFSNGDVLSDHSKRVAELGGIVLNSQMVPLRRNGSDGPLLLLDLHLDCSEISEFQRRNI
jgi:hypothetical protein